VFSLKFTPQGYNVDGYLFFDKVEVTLLLAVEDYPFKALIAVTLKKTGISNREVLKSLYGV